MYYKLIRQPSEGNAVRGTLYGVSHYFNKRLGKTCERLTPICATLENADYLIPPLIYKVAVTRSPRFQRLLPVLCHVPGNACSEGRPRLGIRFHRGTKPQHSKGCILLSAEDEQKLTALWLKEQNNHEETRIELC